MKLRKSKTTTLKSSKLIAPMIEKWKKSIEYKILITGKSWIDVVSMVSIMKIRLLPFESLEVPPKVVMKEDILEMAVFLCICYYSLSTEIRLISDKNAQFIIQSEKLHAKATELCCMHLPSACPLVVQITDNYFKLYTAIDTIVYYLFERGR
jgi:hypothetical protein